MKDFFRALGRLGDFIIVIAMLFEGIKFFFFQHYYIVGSFIFGMEAIYALAIAAGHFLSTIDKVEKLESRLNARNSDVLRLDSSVREYRFRLDEERRSHERQIETLRQMYGFRPGDEEKKNKRKR